MAMFTSLGKKLARYRLPLSNQMVKFMEWRTLAEILSALEINCVLDVGANRGQFASNLREIGYAGRIISFEPLPGEFQSMTDHFKNDALWKGYNIALGDEDGIKEFNVAVESSEMSSFLNPGDKSWKLKVESVGVRRLDAIFDEILALAPKPPRIFMKMDTQGYDVHVIKGAAFSIPKILGIQSELSVKPLYREMPTYLEALQTYQDLGFALTSLSEASRDMKSQTLVELNCVMVRRKMPASAQKASTPTR